MTTPGFMGGPIDDFESIKRYTKQRRQEVGYKTRKNLANVGPSGSFKTPESAFLPGLFQRLQRKLTRDPWIPLPGLVGNLKDK